MTDLESAVADVFAAPPEGGTDAALVRRGVLARLLDEVPEPLKIGRYTLMSRIGEGGMGVVWAAYDEILDRRIALKLLRRQLDDPGLSRRLLREAQSLARLNHPNVVQVFEVGEHDGQLFVAMELVQGVTIRVWQRAATRSWTEVLDCYRQAAAGLAAAHHAGLVHRDFKPDNVLVGDDGRVRVLDFGLARHDEVAVANETGVDALEVTELPHAIDDALHGPLTGTGSVMGTPAYMAPEQFLAEPVDARTDQFAFCIALFEALWGERPFAGASRAELLGNVTRGRVRPVAAERGVPPRIHAVVLRGLAVAPSERWPNIAALQAALAPRVSRVRTWIAAVSIVLLVGVAAFAWMRAPADPCGGGTAIMGTQWDDARARAVSDALHGEPAAARTVGEGLTHYADAWIAASREACEATEVRREQSRERLDRRMSCLDRRRESFEAAVAVLVVPDPTVAGHALAIVDGLPEIERCADPSHLDAMPVVEPTAARAVDQARVELARAVVLRDAGRVADASSIQQVLRDGEAAQSHAPLANEIELLGGRIAASLGKPDDAVAAFERAYLGGIAEANDDVARAAAAELAQVHATQRGDVQSAERWLAASAAMIRRGASDRELIAHRTAEAATSSLRAAQTRSP